MITRREVSLLTWAMRLILLILCTHKTDSIGPCVLMARRTMPVISLNARPVAMPALYNVHPRLEIIAA